MTENPGYWAVLVASLVFAYLGWSAPSYRMPIDYDVMISRSIPFAIAWVLVLAFSMWRYNRRGLWLLIGGPLALYWPVWLLFNHFPPCYDAGDCT